MANFLQSQWMMILGGVVTLATAAVAIFWSKYLLQFLLVVATIAIGVFAFSYRVPEINEGLPATFRLAPQPWFFGLGLVALYSLAHLAATLFRLYSGASTEAAGADGPFADIQSAWREILIQLSHARIDPSRQDLYLLLAPDEPLATSVIRAAGLQLFTQAPASPDAPIHCHATADSLFLSCSGASAVGRHDAEGPARLEYLCRQIAALNPERPTLRGVAILIPFESSKGAESVQLRSAMLDDLQTIRKTLKLNCPTLTICCLRESIPGFNDFASRLPEKLRRSRCGFSVPSSQGTEGAVIRRGMIWMTRWFQVWSLYLMVSAIREKDGNGRLLGMNLAFRASRDALIHLLESGLTVHQQDEPILYRGCYFVACGPVAENHAFAAGLIKRVVDGRDPKNGKLLEDRDLTMWSREADHLDRGYRRTAWALGLVSAAIAAPIWCLGVIPQLREVNYGPVGWAALAGLGLVWAVGLLGPKLRKRSPA